MIELIKSINQMSKTTYIINLIGGPSCGKTTLCALLFAKLKMKKFVAEYVQEYAKNLVWTKDFDTLNNQYLVTKTQYNLFKQINGTVDFIVTDGCLCHGLYYNLYNKDNISNVQKTQQYILDCFNEFNNINIFLERGEFEYETQGRLQTEDESKDIDVILKHLLKQSNIDFKMFKADSSDENINSIIDHIIEKVNYDKINKK